MRTLIMRAAAAGLAVAALGVWLAHRRDMARLELTDLVGASYEAGLRHRTPAQRHLRAVLETPYRDPFDRALREAIEQDNALDHLEATGTDPTPWWERTWPEPDRIDEDD